MHQRMIALDALRDASANAPKTLTEEQSLFVQELQRRQRARTTAVPTDDATVRKCLRQLGEPLTLFAEGAHERRERLRALLAAHDRFPLHVLSALDSMLDGSKPAERMAVDDWEEFYTPGDESLLAVRKTVAKQSLSRALARKQAEMAFYKRPAAEIQRERKALYDSWRSLHNVASQVGCDRPLTAIAFAADHSRLATGAWDGSVRVWDVPSCENACDLTSGPSRIGSVAFHATDPNVLASSDADGLIHLWSIPTKAFAVLKGHTSRVAGLAFDPSGLLLASASHDSSWRLWDAVRACEIQLQEGHSRGVHAIAFHPDGALVGTASLDSHARLWDIRAGKAVWTLSGHHIKALLALAFSPNGSSMATGGEDDTVRIWDMRMLKCVHTLPAHTALVSGIRYAGSGGSVLVTASYDGTAKAWGVHGYELLASMRGHDSKVMAVDVSDEFVCTAGYDRTFKLWSRAKTV